MQVELNKTNKISLHVGDKNVSNEATGVHQYTVPKSVMVVSWRQTLSVRVRLLEIIDRCVLSSCDDRRVRCVWPAEMWQRQLSAGERTPVGCRVLVSSETERTADQAEESR